MPDGVKYEIGVNPPNNLHDPPIGHTKTWKEQQKHLGLVELFLDVVLGMVEAGSLIDSFEIGWGKKESLHWQVVVSQCQRVGCVGEKVEKVFTG